MIACDLSRKWTSYQVYKICTYFTSANQLLKYDQFLFHKNMEIISFFIRTFFHFISYILHFVVKGVMNLIWLPIQQYQEDGRVLWGMRRGADSFLTSSGFAMAELTTKLINLLQVGLIETNE